MTAPLFLFLSLTPMLQPIVNSFIIFIPPQTMHMKTVFVCNFYHLHTALLHMGIRILIHIIGFYDIFRTVSLQLGEYRFQSLIMADPRQCNKSFAAKGMCNVRFNAPSVT